MSDNTTDSSEPTARVATGKQVWAQPQQLLLAVFVIIVAYLFFAPGRSSKSSRSAGNVAEPRALYPHSGYNSDPGSARTLSNPGTPNTPNTPGTARTLSNPDLPSLNPLLQPPPPDEQWLDHPERLRPINPNAPTPKGIIKAPGQPSRRERVGWIENSSGNVLSHKDNVLEDGQMDANDPTELDPGWNGPRLKPKPHSETYNIEDITVRRLFEHTKLPRSIMKRLYEIEYLASQENRGSVLPPQTIEGNDIGDPTKDTWDVAWGGLPKLGVEAAVIVAGFFENDTVEQIKQCMAERRKNNIDKHRSFGAFVKRTDPDGNGTLTPDRLCIGWFADWYRSVEGKRRMRIDESILPMFELVGPPARGLLLLEGFARHFWRQRMFSETGLDLHGLALRLACPARRVPKTNPEDPKEHQRYTYSLELHVFMWGGPSMEGEEDPQSFAGRLHDGSDALIAAKDQLLQTFFHWGHDENVLTICNRRRVIFRPGYTRHGINLSQSTKVNAQKAYLVPIDRSPIIVVYPQNLWLPLADFEHDLLPPMRKIMAHMSPQEVSLFNLRQYQWNTPTLSKENNRLSDLHLLTIMWSIGPNLDKDDKVTPELQTVRRIDFSAFIPLVKTGERAPDNSEQLAFFPLKRDPHNPDDIISHTAYVSLSEIVIPFKDVEPNNPDGLNTMNLLLDPAFGLRGEIESRKVKNGAGVSDHYLEVFVAVPGERGARALSDRVTRYMMSVAADYINSKPRKSPEEVNLARKQAREIARQTYATVLTRIKVVDGSVDSDTSALKAYVTGEPLKVLDPSQWPADYHDLP